VNTNGWTLGGGIENFRIEGSNSVTPILQGYNLTCSGGGGISPLATVTITNHGLNNGDCIFITYINQIDYMGAYPVTVVDSNTVSYPLRVLANPTTPATFLSHAYAVIYKASVGLHCVGVRNYHLRNISVGNTMVGYNIQAGVTVDWDNIRMSKYEEPGSVWHPNPSYGISPECGMIIGARSGNDNDSTTCQTFRNLVIECVGDVNGVGLMINKAYSISIDTGTVESGSGDGLWLNGATASNFKAFDIEAQSNGRWGVYLGAAYQIQFDSCSLQSPMSISGGSGNSFSGCYIYSYVTNSGSATLFQNNNLLNSSAIIDSGSETKRLGNFDNTLQLLMPNVIGGNVYFNGILTATNGVTSFSRNLVAPVAISVTATPFNFTNSSAGGTGGTNNINVFVDGSGVTGSVGLNGTTIFSALVGADATVPLQPGEYVTITYSVGTPVMKWKPF
jgi:hypothetical protein